MKYERKLLGAEHEGGGRVIKGLRQNTGELSGDFLLSKQIASSMKPGERGGKLALTQLEWRLVCKGYNGREQNLLTKPFSGLLQISISYVYFFFFPVLLSSLSIEHVYRCDSTCHLNTVRLVIIAPTS